MPNVKAPTPPPQTPTRADASVITSGAAIAPRGYSLITSAMQRRKGGRTVNTGGQQQ